jgi:hypothetical protein
MGYDGKYGRVTTEHGSIPDDEPVIVFRARDVVAPAVLAFYADRCQQAGSPPRHIELINRTLLDFERWQRAHGSLVPDSESSRAWLPPDPPASG